MTTQARDPAYSSADVTALLAELATSEEGLSAEEASRRLAEAHRRGALTPRRHTGLKLLLGQFTSPIILILVVATVLSMALGDLTDGAVILVIILASGLLGFWQERNAGRAVDALLAQIQVHADVRRAGVESEIALEEVVRGDVVLLRAGDLVPGDCLVLESDSLLVDQAALTGESYPVEKHALAPGSPDRALTSRADAVLLGTHVVSGEATAVVVATGADSQFGALSTALGERDVTTGFERGLTQFGLVLVRAMIVLVGGIFVINLVLGRPLVDSFLFSLALAVGLTPQMLPAIVAVSLAAGARMMARKQVIVRRLDAIEDFGAMTVLCTDKTGTLTAGAVHLDRAVGLAGEPDAEVLRLAGLNAGLQRGYPNPMDQAILASVPPPDGQALGEVPYDFARRRLSVLVAGAADSAPLLVTKGAVADVLACCSAVATGSGETPLAGELDDVRRRVADLSVQGFRVLAVAAKPMPGATTVTLADEGGLTLHGLLAFLDPPKEGAPEAIERLRGQGVSVRMITGDNRLAAGHLAGAVGLSTDVMLTGEEVSALSDADLGARVCTVEVFAEVEPAQKQRIVAALRSTGAVVGYLGDGINDVTALHTADVGISVDSAVDAAKQTASIVLLDKSLDAVAEGVLLGRRTFANTLKYLRVTTSANFGNMLSMAVAAVVLPFLPLLPRQILLLNFLSDIPAMAIAGDTVDQSQLDAPRAWRLRSLVRFMLVYGALSSAFDLATFAVLRLVFETDAVTFRSSWFVVSTLTELAVLFVLRTNRPFFRSRPGRGLLLSSLAIAAVTVAVPYSFLAEPLGLDALPGSILLVLGLLVLLYVVANEAMKRFLPPAS